jgi:thiazole synthase
VKLEVIGDQQTLLPDAAATIEATRVLAAEGFKVMAYTNDDLISALRLEDAGAVCVMPLASPIGSGSACSTSSRSARSSTGSACR